MAKFDLKFIDSKWDKRNCSVYKTRSNEICIRIFDEGYGQNIEQPIVLDKSTAIKLAKTLRTEINKLT
tara:strand:- start:112 stop:315 length:204 start_codon:yes stop_codon:yes gene_type:complete